MRLIDGDSLIERVRYHADHAKQMWMPSVSSGISIACGEIEHAPTIDAEPVRHGRWVELEPEIGLMECNLCGHKIMRATCNYCPNCGAKMDEVSE